MGDRGRPVRIEGKCRHRLRLVHGPDDSRLNPRIEATARSNRVMRLSGRSLRCGGSLNTELGCAGDCLQDDAVALGQTQQRGEVSLAGVGVEVEPDADRPESHRYISVDRERSAKVEFALSGHRAAAHFDA